LLAWVISGKEFWAPESIWSNAWADLNNCSNDRAVRNY
jgi:hypothetical protein